MDKWLTVNPCTGCVGSKTCSKIESFCTALCRYKATVTAQYELLEHQLAWQNNPNITASDIYSRIKSMLAKLEGSNENAL